VTLSFAAPQATDYISGLMKSRNAELEPLCVYFLGIGRQFPLVCRLVRAAADRMVDDLSTEDDDGVSLAIPSQQHAPLSSLPNLSISISLHTFVRRHTTTHDPLRPTSRASST
jgi:hypothetical protein